MYSIGTGFTMLKTCLISLEYYRGRIPSQSSWRVSKNSSDLVTSEQIGVPIIAFYYTTHADYTWACRIATNLVFDERTNILRLRGMSHPMSKEEGEQNWTITQNPFVFITQNPFVLLWIVLGVIITVYACLFSIIGYDITIFGNTLSSLFAVSFLSSNFGFSSQLHFKTLFLVIPLSALF